MMLHHESSAPRPCLRPCQLRAHARGGAPGARKRSLAPCQAQARPFQAGGPPEPGRQAELVRALAFATEAPLVQQQQPQLQQQPLQEPPSVEQQLQQLQALCTTLQGIQSYADKVDLLMGITPVADFFLRTREGRLVGEVLGELNVKEAYVLACLPAIGQEHVLTLLPRGADRVGAVAELACALCRVEDFYDSIGGLLGYQRQCLQLIAEAQQGEQQGPGSSSSSSSSAQRAQQEQQECEFLVPPGVNLSDPRQAGAAAAACAAGLSALPRLAEIYPLGGAGDRLGLRCERSGEGLPTAVLQYCGRTLLEALVRDVQAREYLYWRVHGTQHTTPVAIMTSAAKGNHWRVKQAFEAAGWFGRGRAAFRLFQQPLVPVVSVEDGRWLLTAPLQPLMKPGGHGVIWKLMLDSGVFGWLREHHRQAAIVRQISNPMAGQDSTLLALAGSGFSSGHSFGFASCERVVGAAEGINVLVKRRLAAAAEASDGSSSNGATGNGSRRARYEYVVTNVEYTEFERLGFADQQAAEGSNLSKFPANTNVLYVGLEAAERLVRDSISRGSTDAVLPGMILNTKKKVAYHDAWLGREREVPAGRLECTMQNLADCLASASHEPLEGGSSGAAGLDTFVVYNQRRKVTSSAKRKLKPGSSKVHQTPDGSFYDLQLNAAELLQRCGFEVPEVGTVPDYLAQGPGMIFLFHPALGPLWDVVAQKLRGGRLAPRSELVLEVAEAAVEQLELEGSLLVEAECVMGHMEQAAAAAHPAAQQSAPASHASIGTGREGSSHSVPLRRVKAQGAHLAKVHNGVTHAATEAGAFGAAAIPAGGATPSMLAASSSSSNASSAGRQHSHHRHGATGPSDAQLVYSERCGRVRLVNVRVQNRGIDWEHQGNVYWKHKVARHESLRVVLHGRSEFEAHDVTLAGDMLFEVPDGHRMRVTAGPEGKPAVELLPLGAQPSWRWRYSLSEGSTSQDAAIVLELEEGSA